MKKYLLILSLCASLSGYSQTLKGFFPNGMSGYIYTLQNQYYAHPLYAVNDSTAGFDSAGFYVQSLGRNATNDSIVLTFLNGRRLAALAGAGSGGGGSAAGSTYQVQYNNAGAFAASPAFTYNPLPTAVAGIARQGYFGTSTVKASASGDTLVGLDVANPVYDISNSGSTALNTKQFALRVGGAVNFAGTYTPQTSIGSLHTGFYVHRQLTGNTIDGVTIADSLIANSNNASLTAMRINPTFVNGAFSGVTNTSLSVTGTTQLATLNTSGAITGGSYIQAGTSAPNTIINYLSPDIGFLTSNGNAYFGIENANGGKMPGTLRNDAFIRQAVSGDFAIGDGNSGTKVKVFHSGSMFFKYGGTTVGVTEDTSSALTFDAPYKGVLLPRASSDVKDGTNTGVRLGTYSNISATSAGTFTGVSLTGGTGSGMTATITVAVGSLQGFQITNPGVRYTVGDILTASFGGNSLTYTVTALKYAAKGLMVADTSTGQIAINNGANFTGSVVTSSAAALAIQHGTDYIFTGSSATYTLPSVNSGISGRQNEIQVINAGSGSITVNGSLLGTSSISIAPGATAVLFPTGANFKVKYNQ